MDVITTHINADFDAFSSVVAARRLYPEAIVVFPGSQEQKLREFIEIVYPFDARRIKDIETDKVTRLIIVDAKSPDRLGDLAPLLTRKGITVHVYDHHTHDESDIHGALEKIDQVGATATLFTEIFRERGIRPTPLEATALCLGIYEETGNMLYPNTTERDLRAAAYLLHCGASLSIVATFVKPHLGMREIEVLNKLTHSVKEWVISGIKVVMASATSETYIGDAAPLCHRVMEVMQADAALVLIEMDGKVLIVGRSRTPKLNVAEVLGHFGGGGHPTAAAATLKEQPLELLEDHLREIIGKSARPGKLARDVMTAPVITISGMSTIKEAEDLLTRSEVNAVPVMENDTFAGILTREVVEKALFHQFRESRVIDFTTTDALTATPHTSLGALEEIMVEQNQRFIPIVEAGRVVGAVTRTDLLRNMYEESLRRDGIEQVTPERRSLLSKDITPIMRKWLPDDALALLEECGRIADALGFSAYLVGGSVRDLLRGEKNLDMDVVVEGDGIAFARELAASMGARAHVHERFHTAKVITDGLKIDVASARTEYYETPGALPTVQMSSIKKDLYRRDFTVNTLAVQLNPGRYGRLVDYFGGQRDIKERTIKVLHNLSFIEDPTRAFRAVRFAERFGFRVSRHTSNLIKTTVKMNLFDRLTGSRISDELSLVFEEKAPSKVIAHLEEYGLLGVIHPKLALSEELEEFLQGLDETLVWFGLLFTDEHPDRTRMYLAALVASLTQEERMEALKRLSASERLAGEVGTLLQRARVALRELPLGDAARIHGALAALPIEALLLAMAFTKHEDRKKEVSRYLLEIRKVRTILTGADLMAMGFAPGPQYGAILAALLGAKIRGNLPRREDEERFVREWAGA